MRYFITLFVFALAAMSMYAQKQWTLQECIEYAINNNITVRQMELTMQQQEVNLHVARSGRYPVISANGSHNISFGRGLTAENTYTNKNTNNTSFEISGTLPIYAGGKITNTIRMNRLNLDAVVQDLKTAENDISVKVTEAYVNVLYNWELLCVAGRQVEIDSLQADRLQIMLHNGKSSRSDAAQVESELAQSRMDYVLAESNYRMSLLTLTQLLELNTPEGFDIARPDVHVGDFLVEKPDVVYAHAITFRPEIKAENYRLHGAQKNIDVAKSGYLPTVSLLAGLGSNYYKTSGSPAETFFKQMENNFNQYVGLTVSYNIFNRYETKNAVKSAKLAHSSQRLKLEDANKVLYKEIQQVYYNTVNAIEKYKQCRSSLNSARVTFEMMKEKYEVGKANITEFNEARNNYMHSESNLVQAKYEYAYQIALMKFYNGEPLAF